MNAALQRLRAEIRFDRDAFAKRIAELEGLVWTAEPASAAPRAQAAVALHHAYGSIESIMVRGARQLEGDFPQGPDWHQALLHAMSLDIPGIRPALFSTHTVDVLRRLHGFRHFFRHAYAVDLDAERLEILRREIVMNARRILDEIDELDQSSEQLQRAEPLPTRRLAHRTTKRGRSALAAARPAERPRASAPHLPASSCLHTTDPSRNVGCG